MSSWVYMDQNRPANQPVDLNYLRWLRRTIGPEHTAPGICQISGSLSRTFLITSRHPRPTSSIRLEKAPTNLCVAQPIKRLGKADCTQHSTFASSVLLFFFLCIEFLVASSAYSDVACKSTKNSYKTWLGSLQLPCNHNHYHGPFATWNPLTETFMN